MIGNEWSTMRFLYKNVIPLKYNTYLSMYMLFCKQQIKRPLLQLKVRDINVCMWLLKEFWFD